MRSSQINNIDSTQYLKAHKLCEVDKNGNGLKFTKGELLPHLLVNHSKELKVVTIVGEVGQGKSTFLGLLAQKFTGRAQTIFPTSSFDEENGTVGVQYFILNINDKTDLLLIDCEGFQCSEIGVSEDYQNQLYLLVAQIARISTFTIYISTDERLRPSFTKFLRAVDIEENYKNNPDYLCQKGILSNFIEVLNQHDDVNTSKSKKYPIFHKSCNFSKFKPQLEGEIKISSESNQLLEQLSNSIKSMKYNAFHESMKHLTERYTCKSFFDALVNSFACMMKKGLGSTTSMTEQLNLQLSMQDYIQKEIKKIQVTHQISAKKQLYELFKSTLHQQSYSIPLILMIQKVKQAEVKLQIERDLSDHSVKWRQQYQYGQEQLLKVDQNSHQRTKELIKSFDIDFKVLISEQINLENYKSKGMLNLMTIYYIVISLSSVVLFCYRQQSNYTKLGFYLNLSLYLALVFYNKYSSKTKKDWRNTLKTGLLQNLKQFNLNFSSDSQVLENCNILRYILIEKVSSNLQNSIFSQYDTYTQQFIPLFFFNTLCLPFKDYSNKQMTEISVKYNNLLQSPFVQAESTKDKQVLSTVLIEVLQLSEQQQQQQLLRTLQNEETRTCTNQSILNRVKHSLGQYNDLESPNDQDLLKFIDLLIVCKISCDDIVYSLLLQLLVPQNFSKMHQFTTNQGILKFFEFQNEILKQKLK